MLAHINVNKAGLRLYGEVMAANISDTMMGGDGIESMLM